MTSSCSEVLRRRQSVGHVCNGQKRDFQVRFSTGLLVDMICNHFTTGILKFTLPNSLFCTLPLPSFIIPPPAGTWMRCRLLAPVHMQCRPKEVRASRALLRSILESMILFKRRLTRSRFVYFFFVNSLPLSRTQTRLFALQARCPTAPYSISSSTPKACSH